MDYAIQNEYVAGAADSCDATSALQNEFFNEFDSRTAFSFSEAAAPVANNTDALDFGNVNDMFSKMDSFSKTNVDNCTKH
jgi:hypothetical protein